MNHSGLPDHWMLDHSTQSITLLEPMWNGNDESLMMMIVAPEQSSLLKTFMFLRDLFEDFYVL